MKNPPPHDGAPSKIEKTSQICMHFQHSQIYIYFSRRAYGTFSILGELFESEMFVSGEEPAAPNSIFTFERAGKK